LVLAGRGAALVVGERNLELGAAEAGKTGVLGEREIAEFGMRVVDDVERDFEPGLGMKAGAGGVARQRKNAADLDDLVCGGRVACDRERERGGARQRKHSPELHNDGSPKAPANADLSEGAHAKCSRSSPSP